MIVAVFWTSAAIILYTFFGYPLLLKALILLRGPRRINRSPIEPSVSIVVAAYNEERVIRRRIENLLALDYPPEKLEIIIASDGSTDGTVPVASAYTGKGVVVLPLPRGGKAQCHNEGVKIARGEIIIFTDSDTLFDRQLLRQLVGNFGDSSVGMVTGRLVYLHQADALIARDIGLYWRYELTLRSLESRAGCLVVSSGCCTALRGQLYQPMHLDEDGDDVQPIETVLHGRRVIYDDQAIVYDTPPGSVQGELQARTRMTVQSLTALMRRRQVLNLRKYPLPSISIISHRFLRYLTPVFLICLLLSNLFLAPVRIYRVTLGLQVAFYVLGILYLVLARCGLKANYLSFAGSFSLANLGVLVGVWKFATGERIRAFASMD